MTSGLAYLALAFFVVLAVFPVYWMVITAFKQDPDLINPRVNPFWFHLRPGFNHFVYLFEHTNFLHWILNTGIIGVCTVLITLAIGIPAGYALARLRFRGSENFAIGIFLTYLVPPALLFLPLLRVVANLGIIDTKWALVAVYPTFTLPFCIWLLIGFFKAVPIEVEEAARVDGCNRIAAIFRIVLPLSVAGILTVGIFAFTLAMQEFIYALTFVSSSLEKPVTIGVTQDLIRGDVYFWGSLMAGALLAGIPVAILYNFFLDYFVQGIAQGAVK
ncbi:MAG TPA: carbohydrate ABC transporter permease [Dehalococcoidia bacterium]|nr:carbohydrate ABC transporter permease [Dehalococcoidia bacterium]